MTRFTFLIVGWVLLSFPGCEQVYRLGAGTFGIKETRIRSVSHIPGTSIRIETRNGSIVVEAADRPDVRIVAKIRAESKERLNSTHIVTRRHKGDTLRIEVKWPDGGRRNAEFASFEIYAPDVNGIFASTSNAPIRIKGLSGTAWLRTSNDRIEAMNHIGMLRATTSNDAIVIAGNQGSITAKTSNDDIRVRGVTGPVDARTTNGAIHVNSAESSVAASTSNAEISISLTDDSKGPVVADTSNDPIILVIGEKFAGDVDLKTNERCIVDEQLKRHVIGHGNQDVRLRIGEGPKSRLATRNAPISVMVRDAAQ